MPSVRYQSFFDILQVMEKNIDNRSIQESQQILSYFGAWMGGMIEAGATISISSRENKNNGVTYSYPVLVIKSGNDDMLNKLYASQGGSLSRRALTFEGQNAVDLIISTRDFTVSRQEQVLAVENWSNESDIEERAKIAEEMKGFNRFLEPGQISDYLPLIQNPAFLAGVIDNRGTIMRGKGKNSVYPVIKVYSRNKPLLLALENKYKGMFWIDSEKGTEIAAGVKTFTTQADSYAWKVDFEQARKLLRFCKDFLVIELFEGWNISPSEEIHKATTERNDQILNLVKNEIAKYNGQTNFVSSVKQLANQFSLGTTRIEEILREGLSKEERNKRVKLVYASKGAKKKLSKS